MLSTRQQQVLRSLRNSYAFKSAMQPGQWSCSKHEYCSSSTLYRLLDAELAGLGIDILGFDVVELTPRGRELADLLTTSLTKRQQQVLARFRDFGDQDECFWDGMFNGVWLLPIADDDRDLHNMLLYGERVTASARTINVLVDAELVGFYEDCALGRCVALTPRGRRLAALLPRS